MVVAAGRKIIKKSGEAPTDLENQVASALKDLENKDFKADLANLYIVAVKEVVVDAASGRSALVVFVPFVQHAAYKKIQSKLTRELEKKFSGKHVFFVAQRTIQSTSHNRKSGGGLRSRSRTLTSVHESILNDLVYPTEIVGKRLRVRLDGSKLLKVLLDPNEQGNVENKTESFAAVYKKLTNKSAEFQFPLTGKKNKSE
jgi:small subunit ribosomal protein S7e